MTVSRGDGEPEGTAEREEPLRCLTGTDGFRRSLLHVRILGARRAGDEVIEATLARSVVYRNGHRIHTRRCGARDAPEHRRRDERRHEHHEHDRAEESSVDRSGTESHLREDEAHFATRYHRRADEELSSAEPPRHVAGEHLAN